MGEETMTSLVDLQKARVSLKEPLVRKKEVAYAKCLPLPKNEMPICYFCAKSVTEEDYCFGCKHFVCQDCDQEKPIGNHDVDDHQTEDE